MMKCVLCGEDLADMDAYVKGSITGEVYEYTPGVQPTGQKCEWSGVRFCIKHFTEIGSRIENNLATLAKARREANNDNGR